MSSEYAECHSDLTWCVHYNHYNCLECFNDRFTQLQQELASARETIKVLENNDLVMMLTKSMEDVKAGRVTPLEQIDDENIPTIEEMSGLIEGLLTSKDIAVCEECSKLRAALRESRRLIKLRIYGLAEDDINDKWNDSPLRTQIDAALASSANPK